MVSRSPMVDSPAAAGAGAGSGNTSSRVKAVPPKVMPPYPPPLPEPPSVAAADTQLHRPISRINSGPVDLAGQASPPSASPKPKSFAEKFKSLFR